MLAGAPCASLCRHGAAAAPPAAPAGVSGLAARAGESWARRGSDARGGDGGRVPVGGTAACPGGVRSVGAELSGSLGRSLVLLSAFGASPTGRLPGNPRAGRKPCGRSAPLLRGPVGRERPTAVCSVTEVPGQGTVRFFTGRFS